MTGIRKILVNNQGQPIDGVELMIASRQAVKDGYMINEPVLLVFPDGNTVQTVEARVTQEGMKQASRMMAAENGGVQ